MVTGLKVLAEGGMLCLIKKCEGDWWMSLYIDMGGKLVVDWGAQGRKGEEGGWLERKG
jgi:hypothetical protein